MAPIFVGNKAERAAFKNAGGFTSEMRKQKGKAYDIKSYAAERSKSNVSVIRNAASGLAGTVKPGFTNLATIGTAGLAPAVLRPAVGKVGGGLIKTQGAKAENRSRVEAGLAMIPDLPGSWDDKAKAWIVENQLTTGLLAGGVVGAAGGFALGRATARRKKKSTRKKSTRKKSTRKKSRTSRSTSRRRKSAPTRRARRRGYGTEAQYKRKGGKDVKYTKNGQPYVIQSNGRARFIKRSR